MTMLFAGTYREPLQWLCVALCALAVAAAASLPWFQAIGLAVLLLPILAALSRFRLTGLTIVFLVCENLVHFLKRVIFVFGSQPQYVYLGVQLLPTLVFAALCLAAFQQLLRGRLPRSAKILAFFLLICLAATGVTITYVPWMGTLAAIHQQLLPFLMFYVGLSLSLEQFAKAGRTLALLAIVSCIDGILQLVMGPTAIDRVWAAQTYAYSIHGSKVFDYLQGNSPEFRAYSYYADPLTWGLFLVAGFIGAVAARALSKLSRILMASAAVLIFAGLFTTMTRTCWASFLGTLGAYLLLRRRSCQKPWLVFGGVVGAFAVAIVGGTFLYEEVFLAHRLPVVQNQFIARYITVGTIEARISAWDVLKQAAIEKPFGYGVMPYVRKRSEAPEWDRPLFSHDFLAELVLDAGIPGLFFFLLFYLQWLREGFAGLRKAREPGKQRALLWMIAYSVGSLFSGYLNGLNFATYEFFLVTGVVAGHAMRLANEARERQVPVFAAQRPGVPPAPIFGRPA